MEFTIFHIVIAVCISLLVGAMAFIPLGIAMGKDKKTDKDDSRMPIPPSLRVPSTSNEPATVQTETEDHDDDGGEDADEDDDEYRSPFEERLVAAGYECRFMEDDYEFDRVLSGQFNFSPPDCDTTCDMCGADIFPMGVWKNPGTHNETPVGYFCDCCGNGFTVSYSLKHGYVTKKAATVGGLLKIASLTVVNLPAATDTEN